MTFKPSLRSALARSRLIRVAPRGPVCRATISRRFVVVAALGSFESRFVWALGPGTEGRVGYLFSSSQSAVAPLVAAFEHSLTERGHTLGKTVQIDYRFGIATPEGLRRSALELSEMSSVLVTSGTVAAIAAKDAGVKRPVVFVSVGFPVALGLVESLRRPGANFTGISFEAAEDTYGKRLQMLKEIVPGLRLVAALGDGNDRNIGPAFETLHRLAPGLQTEVIDVRFQSENELTAAFANMAAKKVDGLVVIAGALTYRSGRRVAQLALEHRLPSVYGFKESVASGGLVSLGPDLVAMADQAAEFVDMILRGANPSEIPVQQPSRYEVAINLTSARKLGVKVPPSLRVRADVVVE